MAIPTYTIIRSWQSGADADPRFWATAKGVDGPLKADVLIPVGTAIRVVHGRAVTA